MLHFIQNNSAIKTIEKALRVRPYPRNHIGLFKQDIVRLWEQVAEQGCLTRAARTGKNKGGKGVYRLQHLFFQGSCNVFHGDILKVIV